MDINEKIEFEKLMTILCDGVDKAIESDKYLLVENKQKINAISAFLEFIKAGADIEAPIINDNKVTFTIIMK